MCPPGPTEIVQPAGWRLAVDEFDVDACEERAPACWCARQEFRLGVVSHDASARVAAAPTLHDIERIRMALRD